MSYIYSNDPTPWYYIYQNQQRGPVTIRQMQENYYVYRELSPETLVWKEGMTYWEPLHTTELIQHLSFAPQAAQAEPPRSDHTQYASNNPINTYPQHVGQYDNPYDPARLETATGYSQSGWHQLPPVKPVSNLYLWLLLTIPTAISIIFYNLMDLDLYEYTIDPLSFFSGHNVTLLILSVLLNYCINLWLLSMDRKILQDAGHKAPSLGWFFFPLIYLILRATNLKQVPVHAIIFVVLNSLVAIVVYFIVYLPILLMEF